jgi:hypothetical protein
MDTDSVVRWVVFVYYTVLWFGIEQNFNFYTAYTAFELWVSVLPDPAYSFWWGLPQIALIQTWTVAVGISVITIQDERLMEEQSAKYGAPLAWFGNVILHYIPPMLQSWYTYHHRHLLARSMHPRNLLVWMMSVLCSAFVFCVVSDPIELYHIDNISLLTLFGFLAPIVALVALCLAAASAATADARGLYDAWWLAALRRAVAAQCILAPSSAEERPDSTTARQMRRVHWSLPIQSV